MSREKNEYSFAHRTGSSIELDARADVRGEDRTGTLVTALHEYLQDATHDDALVHEITDAYYDDKIAFEQLKSLVGAEEAANFRVLEQHLNEDFVDEVAEL